MKKKNLFGWLAMAAMVLGTTGCSNDEVVNDYSAENAIQFGTYIGRNAEGRGTVLDDSNLNNFGVFASYTGQSDWVSSKGFNFMFNQQVTKTDGAWAYTPIKYWPTTQDDKISFWAYAPYAASKAISVVSTNSSTGSPQIKYTLTADNLGEAEDFTADVLVNETRSGNGNSIDSQDRNVTFNLMHELSRIAFEAKLDRDAYGNAAANKTQVNITKIEFGGTKFATEATYTFATADNTRGTWAFTDGATTTTLDIATLLNTSTESLGGYTEEGVRVKDEELVSLFTDDSYLFHIPTNGTDGTAAEGDVTLTITYDIVTVDANLKDGYSKTPATKRFKLPAASLKQGTAYKYILTFGLNEIKLSASVANWDEGVVDDCVDWAIEDVK